MGHRLYHFWHRTRDIYSSAPINLGGRGAHRLYNLSVAPNGRSLLPMSGRPHQDPQSLPATPPIGSSASADRRGAQQRQTANGHHAIIRTAQSTGLIIWMSGRIPCREPPGRWTMAQCTQPIRPPPRPPEWSSCGRGHRLCFKGFHSQRP